LTGRVTQSSLSWPLTVITHVLMIAVFFTVQFPKVLAVGGEFFACGACLKLRESEGTEICPLSTLKDHYEIVRDSDRLVTV